MDSPRHPLLHWLRIVIVIGMFTLGAYLYPSLPDRVPTHWNFAGVADGFSSRPFGAFLLPCIGLLILILFPVLQKLDPKAENYTSFQGTWEILQLSIIAFMAYVYVIQLIATFDPSQSAMVGRYIVFGVGALFVLLGNFMGKIRQNFFIGLRTPWTLSDPEVWAKSQRFAGWTFVLGGLAIIVEAFFWRAVPVVFLVIVAGIVIASVGYSYVLFASAKKASPKEPVGNDGRRLP